MQRPARPGQRLQRADLPRLLAVPEELYWCGDAWAGRDPLTLGAITKLQNYAMPRAG